MVKFKNVSEIKGFENFNNYLIGTDGSLINTKLNKSVAGTKNNVYKMYTLSNKKHKCTVLTHRLVAQAFIPNDDINKTEVDHIDRDQMNNNVSNLRWSTVKQNRKNRQPATSKAKRFVIAENLATKETKLFNSIIEASRELNVNYNNLYSTLCCKNRNTAAGYKFYFANK